MENENRKFPTKRDFFYIVGILVGVIIAVVTGRLADNVVMVEYVGFAGTIVSILLAVLAIIYSFYQSSTYENATHKLDTSSKKIKKATESLSDVSEIKAVVSEFKEDVQIINGSIKDMKEIIDNMDKEFGTMKQSFEDTKEKLFGLESNVGKDFAQEYSYEYFQSFVGNSNKMFLFLLLLINKLQGNEIDLSTWSKVYCTDIEQITSVNDAKIQRYVNAQVGILATFNQLGFLDVNMKGEAITRVFNINTLLSKAIDEIEEKLIDEGDEKFIKVITEMNKFKSQ